ncbi:hypothetical protein HPB47_021344, partial [Ixodes persulcatus]
MSDGSWARLLLLPAAAIAMRYSADSFKLCPDGGKRYIKDVDTGVDDAMALIGMMSYNKYGAWNACPTGRGNIRPGSEFNFLVDPEAAEVVLQRVECNVTIVPWEAVLKSTLPW